MADEIDMANDLIDSEVSRALQKIRQSSSQGEGSDYCVECGDEMPTARQKMGFKFCVSCAEERERRKQLFVED